MSSARVEKRGSATTVKACDSCRRRKKRCLWTVGERICNHCIQLKEQCTTTYVRKQRTKLQKKKDRAIEYERRIQNLESLLQESSAAQPNVQQQPLQPAEDLVPLSTWTNNLRTEVDAFATTDALYVDLESYFDSLEDLEEEQLSAQITNSHFVGDGAVDASFEASDDFEPSADYQIEAALLQDPSFQPALTVDGLSLSDTATPYKCDSYLPPPELGTSLLTEFLIDFNAVMPLYRPHDIAEHLRICYAGGSDGSPLAWACTYIVFGIAHRSRGMSAVATPEDDQLADWYLCKILPTISGLLASPPSLGLVQSLLGVAQLIRSSRHDMPYALYMSTALRIAQSLAYDSSDNFREQSDQQRRVFWLAFILDTDENMYSNVPTTHRREDIQTMCPADDPFDSLGTVTAAEGTLKVNIFALSVQLVLVQSEVIEQVLSMNAHNRTPQESATITHNLLLQLQKWHDNELSRRNAEELMQLLYRSDLLHTLSVEASYFATVFRLQAFLVLGMDPRINAFSTESLYKLAAQKNHAAYRDAGHLLDVLSMTPHTEIGISSALKRPLVAALVTILSHHLHSLPDSAPSSLKMREYSDIMDSMGKIIHESQDLDVRRGMELATTLFTKVKTGLEYTRMRE